MELEKVCYLEGVKYLIYKGISHRPQSANSPLQIRSIPSLRNMHAEEESSLTQSKLAEVNLVIEGDKVLQHHFRIPNHGRRLKLVYSRPLCGNSVSTLSGYFHCICMYACQAELFCLGMHTCKELATRGKSRSTGVVFRQQTKFATHSKLIAVLYRPCRFQKCNFY